MKQKRNDGTFDCPECGNPLILTHRYAKIKCVYCERWIDVPGYKERPREARHGAKRD